MYIDLNRAKNEFLKYVSNYDSTNKSIERKIYHSLRVMELSNKLSNMIGLNQEDTELASLIGLLHDLGRFDQQTKFKTFNDLKSFDHGNYGVEILNKDIRKYVESSKYDDIIKVAVKNHNKYAIEDGLTDRELFFAKLIRDADKLDILYEATSWFWVGQEDEIKNTIINSEILESFFNKKLIKNEAQGAKEGINAVISEIAIIFDLYFKESFEILKEGDYINKTINRFDYPDKEIIEKVRNFANNYIDSQL